MVDDRGDAAVEGGHQPQVGGRQPPERDARHPPSVVEQLVEHLVVGRLRVRAVLHGLGPRGEELLGAVGMVEVGDRAADIGRVPVGDVGLVGPEVEERDVAGSVGPRVVEEEVRELVELEVDVEEDHGLPRLLELVEQEGGLHRDHAEAELTRALGCRGTHEAGTQHRRLAAHAERAA
eukprot:scaffold45460_cov67-Phaeocystis_antarctica.AAC.4